MYSKCFYCEKLWKERKKYSFHNPLVLKCPIHGIIYEDSIYEDSPIGNLSIIKTITEELSKKINKKIAKKALPIMLNKIIKQLDEENDLQKNLC